MRYSDGYSDVSLRRLSGLSATSHHSAVFLSNEQGVHRLAFLRVGMGCCGKYGVHIGFSVALKCFVGSNLNCICNLMKIHHPLYMNGLLGFAFEPTSSS